jgi:hypothetical protein
MEVMGAKENHMKLLKWKQLGRVSLCGHMRIIWRVGLT